jgi:multisubunit Na+/H+ antiporter MnhE subunit
MSLKKLLIMTVLSLLFGFTSWYLVFSFLASDFNPLDWSVWLKVFYLICSLITANALLRRVFTKEDID